MAHAENRYSKSEMNKFPADDGGEKLLTREEWKRGAQESLARWIIYQQHQHSNFSAALDVFQLKVFFIFMFPACFFLVW